MMNNTYLVHHGIKGMKWGVRRTPEQLGYIRGGTALPTSYPDVFKRKTGFWSSDADMKVVNPGFADAKAELDRAQRDGTLTAEWYSNWSHWADVNNCATCSVVFDLRQRGYDVEANATYNLAMYNDAYMDEYYEGIERTTAETLDELTEQIEKMGPNARGTLNGVVVNGGGHAIAWENVNGKVVFRDCQSGEAYSSQTISDLYSDFSTKRALGHYTINRLDRATPNLDKLYENGIVNKRGTYANEYGENEKIDAKIRDTRGSASPKKRQQVDINNAIHPDKLPSATKWISDRISELTIDSQTNLAVSELERRKR